MTQRPHVLRLLREAVVHEATRKICIDGKQHSYWGPVGLFYLAGRFAHAVCREGLRGVAEKLKGAGRRALARGDDASWAGEQEAVETRRLGEMRRTAERLVSKPLVSIVMPACDSRLPWLREAIDSVRAQAYPHWELCIAGDASPKAGVREPLEEYAARERRIRLVFRDQGGRVAAAIAERCSEGRAVPSSVRTERRADCR